MIKDLTQKRFGRFARYRMILEHCADFVRDLENRHLIECHECYKDLFRWKSISIARDFLSLRGLLKPFAREDKERFLVRPDTTNADKQN